MKERCFSPSLQDRVLSYFHYQWGYSKGVNRQDMLVDMPSCLHADVCLATTGQLMREVRIKVQLHKCHFILRVIFSLL